MSDTEIKVTKSTSVQSLKRQFKEHFNCSLEVYYGNNRIAEDSKKIHEIAHENYKGERTAKMGSSRTYRCHGMYAHLGCPSVIWSLEQ